MEIKREMQKLKIDQIANRIVNEVNEYEAKCKNAWPNSGFKDRLKEIENELIGESKSKLDSWLEQFKIIDLNQDKWKDIKQSSELINSDLNSSFNTLKQELLLNRHDEYRIKPLEFNEIDINSKKYFV